MIRIKEPNKWSKKIEWETLSGNQYTHVCLAYFPKDVGTLKCEPSDTSWVGEPRTGVPFNTIVKRTHTNSVSYSTYLSLMVF